jgi:hypothetical protein
MQRISIIAAEFTFKGQSSRHWSDTVVMRPAAETPQFDTRICRAGSPRSGATANGCWRRAVYPLWEDVLRLLRPVSPPPGEDPVRDISALAWVGDLVRFRAEVSDNPELEVHGEPRVGWTGLGCATPCGGPE